MKISKIQKYLEELKDQYGDIDVCIAKDNLEFQDVRDISKVTQDTDHFIVLSNIKLNEYLSVEAV